MLWKTVLAGLALNLPLCGQSWDTLKSLKPGESIKVLDSAGKESKGAFRAVGDAAITLAGGSAEISIERSRIRRIQVRAGSRRLRNVLIGTGIGLAIGITVDQTLGTYLRNETGDSGRAATYAAPIILFGGIGAALPAYRTVYRGP